MAEQDTTKRNRSDEDNADSGRANTDSAPPDRVPEITAAQAGRVGLRQITELTGKPAAVARAVKVRRFMAMS